MKLFPQGNTSNKEAMLVVKGISRQVIVVQSPDPRLFDQAIFILKDEAVGKEGITDELLLKEATRLISRPQNRRQKRNALMGPIWACGGALLTGILWLLTAVL